MLRFLAGCKIKDKVSIKSLLEKFSFLSVNQLNAQIKLMEAWKATHVPSYPFQILDNNPKRLISEREVRATTTKKWKDHAKTKAARESMSIDCARLWNFAPPEVTNAVNLAAAKREIKKLSRTLEI